MQLLRSLLDLLFPPVCSVCRRPVESEVALCPCCDPVIATFGSDILVDLGSGEEIPLCRRCGEPADTGEICGACRLWPLATREMRSIWRYAGPTAHVIKALKYTAEIGLVRCCREWLAIAAQQSFSVSRWDGIVPLPSSSQVLRERGFSQTLLLGRALGKRLRCRVEPRILRSRVIRPPQAGLPPAERLKNVADAFVADRPRVSGRSLLLVDDVTTTGASIQWAAIALRKGGALHVDALTIARSIQFPTSRGDLYRSMNGGRL